MTTKNENLIKKSIFRRIYQHIDFSISFSWDNLVIAILTSFLLYFFAVGVGIIDVNLNLYLEGMIAEITKSMALLLKRFFILGVFIILFLIRKIPIKSMAKQVVIFAVFLAIAFLTTFLCRMNIYLFIIVSFAWLIVFIFTQQNETLKSVGSFTIISYVFYLSLVIPLTDCTLGFMLNSSAIIFVMVLLASIPMFIVRLLQGDPYKKELMSGLFDRNNSFYELNNTRKSLLNVDKSNYAKGLINVAEELFVSNINLKTLSFNLEYKDKINQFSSEIDKLTDKVKSVIRGSTEDGFKIDTNKITSYTDNDVKSNQGDVKSNQGDVKTSKNISKSNNKTFNQLFLNYMSKKYKNSFEKLNYLFLNKSNPELKEPVDFKGLHLINEEFKTDSVEFRYSLRFVLVLLICFIWDYLNHNMMFTATLLSFFTLTTNLIFNSEVFLIRVYATVMSVLVGLAILLIFSFFNITFLLFPLSTIAFFLFFLFKDNGYRACFLFLLGFILWSPQGTVDTAILFTTNGILSLVVIIFIFNFIMPKKSKTNVIKLLVNKIDLTKESIKEFYDNGFKEETLEKLNDNKVELNTTLKKLDDKYENVNDDMELFNKLFQLLDDYGHKVNSIKLILDDEKINYDADFILERSDYVLDSFKSTLEGNNDNQFEKELYELKEYINDKQNVDYIHPILISIVLDADEISQILVKLNDKNLIKKYDANLIRNIFNVQDIYA